MDDLPKIKPKVRLLGEPGLAQAYIGEAYNLLFQVRQFCETSGAPVFAMSRALPNGAVVTAAVIGGEHIVSCSPPPLLSEPLPQSKPVLSTPYGFVFAPAAFGSPNPADLVFFGEPFGNANPPLGTVDGPKSFWRLDVLSQTPPKYGARRGQDPEYGSCSWVGKRTFDILTWHGPANRIGWASSVGSGRIFHKFDVLIDFALTEYSDAFVCGAALHRGPRGVVLRACLSYNGETFKVVQCPVAVIQSEDKPEWEVYRANTDALQLLGEVDPPLEYTQTAACWAFDEDGGKAVTVLQLLEYAGLSGVRAQYEVQGAIEGDLEVSDDGAVFSFSAPDAFFKTTSPGEEYKIVRLALEQAGVRSPSADPEDGLVTFWIHEKRISSDRRVFKSPEIEHLVSTEYVGGEKVRLFRKTDRGSSEYITGGEAVSPTPTSPTWAGANPLTATEPPLYERGKQTASDVLIFRDGSAEFEIALSEQSTTLDIAQVFISGGYRNTSTQTPVSYWDAASLYVDLRAGLVAFQKVLHEGSISGSTSRTVGLVENTNSGVLTRKNAMSVFVDGDLEFYDPAISMISAPTGTTSTPIDEETLPSGWAEDMLIATGSTGPRPYDWSGGVLYDSESRTDYDEPSPSYPIISTPTPRWYLSESSNRIQGVGQIVLVTKREDALPPVLPEVYYEVPARSFVALTGVGDPVQMVISRSESDHLFSRMSVF